MRKTYLELSSGVDGKDPNVTRTVVVLNRSTLEH